MVMILDILDVASSHWSKSNIFLLDKLFQNDGWIQNPHNPLDFAYSIEKLLGIINPRVHRREPKKIEQLKKYLLEEWNTISNDMIKNLYHSYLERIKKVYELNGERIEQEYFKKKKNLNINGKFRKICLIRD